MKTKALLIGITVAVVIIYVGYYMSTCGMDPFISMPSPAVRGWDIEYTVLGCKRVPYDYGSPSDEYIFDKEIAVVKHNKDSLNDDKEVNMTFYNDTCVVYCNSKTSEGYELNWEIQINEFDGEEPISVYKCVCRFTKSI